MTSSCTSSSSSNFFPARCYFSWRNMWKCFLPSHNGVQKPDVHLLHWEIVWRNAPCIWRDFELALPLQTRLTQTKPVLPLSDKHGSQVKDQGRWQCCHNKHKKFPYWPTCDVSLLSGRASYNRMIQETSIRIIIFNSEDSKLETLPLYCNDRYRKRSHQVTEFYIK